MCRRTNSAPLARRLFPAWRGVCAHAGCPGGEPRARGAAGAAACMCIFEFVSFLKGLGVCVPFRAAGCQGVREGFWGPHLCLCMFCSGGPPSSLPPRQRGEAGGARPPPCADLTCRPQRQARVSELGGVDRGECNRCWRAVLTLPPASAGRGWRSAARPLRRSTRCPQRRARVSEPGGVDRSESVRARLTTRRVPSWRVGTRPSPGLPSRK